MVDDNQVNRKLLTQYLSRQGHAAETAEDGRKALDKLRTNPFDLILLDVEMPRLNGFETLAAIKQDPAQRHIPVIMITAVEEMDSTVRCIEMGAEDYLHKPFNPVLLKARIDASLEKKRLRDAEQLYLKNLERELEIAREIQMDFLPDELPQVAGWEIAAYFKAARIVAGDFYDVFPLPDGKIVLVIADVCDKGVGAALFMTLFRSLIRAAATTDFFQQPGAGPDNQKNTRILRAIRLTNNYIAETHGSKGMFATMFIGLLDPVDGSLVYINGGHEPPLVLAKGQQPLVPLVKTGPAVGVLTDAQFGTAQIRLAGGDVLVAFTDGVPDGMNPQGEFFGRDRLNSLIKDAPANSLINKIESELHAHMKDADQFDDITLLIVRRVRQ